MKRAALVKPHRASVAWGAPAAASVCQAGAMHLL
jgi:hypothetical protein